MGVTLFEKPPLLLWLLQLSGWLAGFTDAAMRFPAALGSTLTLVYTFKLTRLVLANRAGQWFWPWLAVAILGSSWTFIESGSRVMTDSLLAASVVAMCYYAMRLEASDDRRWSVYLGVAAGLGFMTKSFALAPAALALSVFLLWKKRGGRLAESIGIAAIVAIPWHVVMTLRYGAEFWDVYVGYHVLGRAEGISVGQQDVGFYLSEWLVSDPMVVIALIPGLLSMVIVGIKSGLDRTLLPLLVAILGLIFIHLSQTKFLHYALPIIPVLTIVTVSAAASISITKLGIQLLVLIVLGSSSFFVQKKDHESYRPELRKLAEKHILPSSQNIRLIVFNDYAPALYYYGERKGELWTDSQRFYDIQQSIDMMKRSGIVHLADKKNLSKIREETRPMLLMAPHRTMSTMTEEMANNPMSVILRRLMHHYAAEQRNIDWTREEGYLVVHVEGLGEPICFDQDLPGICGGDYCVWIREHLFDLSS